MDNKEIGRFIRKLRIEKNMTQQELAEKLMVRENTILKWENGKMFPNTELLIPLCEQLEIDVLDLIKGRKVIDKDEAVIGLIKYESEKIKIWKYLSIGTIVIALFIILIIIGLIIK